MPCPSIESICELLYNLENTENMVTLIFVIYLTYFERQVFNMKRNNLFFYSGEGLLDSQQIVLNGERTVTVIDCGNEFEVQNVRKIEIKPTEQSKIKLHLGPQVAFVSSNKRVVINEEKDGIYIEMLNSQEQLSKYTSIVNAQEAQGLINYIREYAPGLYSDERLHNQSLQDLRKLKENMDDLANCY